MADEGLRFEAWTLPHVGTFAKKFDFTRLVESYTLNDRFNDLCDGVFSIPDDAALATGVLLKNRLLYIDEANHVNDVGSTIRVFRGSTPILNYITTRLEDSWSDSDPTSKLSVEGLEWILDRVLVPNYDHPADPAKEPDWIYGAPSILQNTDLETSGITSGAFQISVNATAGTFTVTLSAFGTSGAINWNADADAIHTAIEAITGINDVTVSGDGTDANPFVIEVLDPANVTLGTLSTNSAGLTGLATIQTITVGGASITDPWTRSFNPVTGLYHGTYNFFNTSTVQAHGGTYSLYVNGDLGDWTGSFPGAQQIVTVTGGRTYRASVWVYPKFNARYRFVIRTADETLIAAVEADLTANSWQELAIPSVLMPDHVNSVIFRVACIANVHSVQEFYLDDALLAPGFAAATLGAMMDDVRTAAIAVGSPLAWLVPTWTRTHDSDGVPWDSTRMWNVNHGQSLYQLIEYKRRWNYESRVGRWDVGSSQFKWDMWNPSAGGQVRANIAITGKSGVTGSAPIVKRPPGATYVKTEGAQVKGGLPWGEFASSTLDDVWGRLERFHQDRQGVDSTELDELAERIVTKGGDNTASRKVTVSDPSLLPWTAYEPGDTLTLNLAPKDDKKVLRVAAIVASMGPSDAAPSYDVHFGAPVYSNDVALAAQGSSALAQGVRTLIREFRRPTPTSLDGTPVTPAAGGGGAPTVVVAAADSTQFSKDRADFQCVGVNDQATIQAAVNAITVGFGRVILCEGNYNLALVGGQTAITVPSTISILGLGRESTYLLVDSYTGSGTAVMLKFAANFYLRDVGFWNVTSTDVIAVQVTGGNGDITNCRFDIDGKGLDFSGSESNVEIAGNLFNNGDAVQPNIDIENGQRFIIRNNMFFEGLHQIRVEDTAGTIIIVNNTGEMSAEEGYKFAPGDGAYSAESVIIQGNQIYGSGGNGSFSGILIDTTNDPTLSGLGFHVIGNVVEASTKYGIELVDANLCRLVGNYVEEAGRHGIALLDSSDNMLHSNYIWQPSQETDITYDGIFLAGDSNDNSIQANQFIKHTGATPRTRYCVNVSANTCDRTVVVSNQMRNGYVTAAINNAGTGTIITYPGGGAGIGDNFV